MFWPATGRLVVVFDRLLLGGVVEPGNWRLRYENGWWNSTGSTAGYYRVESSTVQGGPGAGPNVVQYRPPPFDVVGRDGKEAAGFTALGYEVA